MAAQLPQKLPLDMMQTKWASQLNPVLSIPMLSGLMLQNVVLKSGDNVINHLLGRMQQGTIITDQTAASSIYRSKPFNSTTLTLNSSAACQVNLWVF